MTIELTKQDFYEIAKLVDSDFIGSQKTFTADRKVGYNYATTNKYDFASFLRIWNDGKKVTSIERLGEDTDGWQLVHHKTMENVNQYLKNK